MITDAVGVSERAPPFGDVRAELVTAVEAYRDEVVKESFPGEEKIYLGEFEDA